MTSSPGLRGIPSTPTSQDPARTLRWRRHQLMAAGLDELSAHRLAAGADVDIHAVLTLQDTAADTDRASLRGRIDAVNQDPRHD
jgi:hypothetical protein